MRKFTVISGLIVGILLTGLAILGASSGTASARVTVAETQPSAEQVQALLAKLANGSGPDASDRATVLFVLDSTERYAARKRCGFDSRGKLLSADGEWYEADLVGKTMKDIGNARTQRSAKLKLSYHNGQCYLMTSGDDVHDARQAYAGATRRTALALSKMLGQSVELRDPSGKVTGVYRWSNKW